MHNTNVNEQFFSTLTQLKRVVSQQVYESHEEKVATMLQFSALNFLKDKSEVNVGDLAKFLQLSKSSATQLIERLVKMGLVKRINDRQDRRIIRLTITSKGEDEFIVLKTKLKEKMNRFLSKIPEKDIKELIRIHANLIETLKNSNRK